MSTILKTLQYNMENNLKSLGRILLMCNEIKGFYRGIAEFPNLDFINENSDSPFISIYNEDRGLTVEFYVTSDFYFRGSWITCNVKIIHDDSGESDKPKKRKYP